MIVLNPIGIYELSFTPGRNKIPGGLKIGGHRLYSIKIHQRFSDSKELFTHGRESNSVVTKIYMGQDSQTNSNEANSGEICPMKQNINFL
ncbi:hypothetical protein TNCT_531771 [Trichonephila clavata]|uniref:Uncharacterized protein n=1 Tax=Trichonephila clavata TaxID=2740835 RepID=A0A8X6F0X1_TRICU|nr:hypothetical protein TNCT_531771 [Trichonephila clavata]